MLARFVMFGVCLLAAWLIWRAVRGWLHPGGARGERSDEPPRLDHRPDANVMARPPAGPGESIDRDARGQRHGEAGDSEGRSSGSSGPGDD